MVHPGSREGFGIIGPKAQAPGRYRLGASLQNCQRIIILADKKRVRKAVVTHFEH